MAMSFPRMDDLKPLTGPALILAAFVLALSNFMAILDQTIANVSVPNIAGGLAISPNEGTWVITSYSVAEAITVPLSGWLAMRFGAVRVFCIAVASFGVCSFLCGLAPNLGLLVTFRIMQGLSGGPMMPLSQSLMLRIFPPERRAQAMGLWAMTTVVGPIAGPLLGGAILDNLSWSWIFFVNIPVAAVIFFFATRLLPRYELPLIRRPVDYIGLALLILWVGSLQIMLDKGEEVDWFNSTTIIMLAAVAAVGFFSFLIWELTQSDPIVDLSLFRSRAFATCCIVMVLTYGSFFAAVVLVPLWLQTSMGYSAAWSGRVMAVQGIFSVILSPIIAQLVRRTDPRRVVFFGVLVVTGVLIMRTGLNTGASYWQLTLPQLILGIGMPCFFIGVNTLALNGLSARQTPAASGLLSFLRTTAGAFAVSLVTTNWANAGITARVGLSGRLNSQSTLDQMQAMGMTAPQALGSLDQITQQQAVMVATNNIFTVLAVIAFISAFSIWLAPKPVGAITMGGGH